MKETIANRIQVDGQNYESNPSQSCYVKLSKREREVLDFVNNYDFPRTRQEIGSELGISPITVSRIATHLRKKGVPINFFKPLSLSKKIIYNTLVHGKLSYEEHAQILVADVAMVQHMVFDLKRESNIIVPIKKRKMAL